jgi:hypothetical protein
MQPMNVSEAIESTPNLQFLCWLVVEPPLWKMMEFVNGKDDIPYMMDNKKILQTTKLFQGGIRASIQDGLWNCRLHWEDLARQNFCLSINEIWFINIHSYKVCPPWYIPLTFVFPQPYEAPLGINPECQNAASNIWRRYHWYIPLTSCNYFVQFHKNQLFP